MIQIIGPQLSQWDTGRSLEASGSTATHAHFANRGDSHAVIMELVDGKTKIPDYLLQTGKDLCVYLVLEGVTQESKTFSVRKREKPENYVYEDDQRNYIYKLIADAQAATNAANQVALDLLNAKGKGEFNGKDGAVGADGKSIFLSRAIIDGPGGTVKTDTIYTGGRTVQLLDLILSTNGYLYRVAGVTSDSIMVAFVSSIRGVNGADGYTPVRGKDYWTDVDKTEMVNEVLEELPDDELPIFNLSEMGLPPVTLDGAISSVVIDCTELCQAAQAGPVKVQVSLSANDITVETIAICNGYYFKDSGHATLCGIFSDVTGTYALTIWSDGDATYARADKLVTSKDITTKTVTIENDILIIKDGGTSTAVIENNILIIK